MAKKQGLPQSVMTGVILTVTAIWAASLLGEMAGWWHSDPGIDTIMGGTVALVGVLSGKARLPRNTIRIKPDAKDAEDVDD